MPGDETGWITIGEAARRLGIGRTKMREIADAREVNGVPIRSRRMPGSLYRQVSVEDVGALVQLLHPSDT